MKQPILWLLLALLPFAGCDSCLGRTARQQTGGIELYRSDAPIAQQRQTPVSPLGGPSQTPYMPQDVQSPYSPYSHPEPDVPSEYDLAIEKIRQISNGMSHEDIAAILEGPGILIAGGDSSNMVYQWTLASMTFMGRFEQGVLVRSNILNQPAGTSRNQRRAVFRYDQALYDSIQTGMRYEDVVEAIGTDPESLTDGASTVSVYQWRDSRGSSVIGRFEDGVLVRKSGKILAPEEQPDADTPTQEGVTPEVEYRFPITEEEDSDTNTEGVTPVIEESAAPDPEPLAPPQQVHVAGASRRERDQDETSPYAGRSYKPVAKFPDYSRRIRRGDFEIRIQNRAIIQADVAIISDEGGRDANIVPGGTASFFVGRGIYQLYYIYGDDPFTLYQGQQIPVDITLADYVVTIFDDSYTVNYLDRNMEPSSSSRR